MKLNDVPGLDSPLADAGNKLWEVIIVGAGMAGIGAAIRLQEQGSDDFLVLEKAVAVGGTWRENTYPGCACDVPSRLYSYSFAPNPHWSRTFARQTEILAYLSQVAHNQGIERHIRFGVDMRGAQWNSQGQHWDLETSAGPLRTKVLICATGPIHVPNTPDLPGLAQFQGKVFHSSNWQHDYALSDKRVAVIGTGASAVQFIPKIQPLLAKLHLFQRTPSWVLPKPDPAISPRMRGLFARFPLAQKLLRGLEAAWFELIGIGFRHPFLLKRLERSALRYLDRSVPDPVLRAKLTPSFTLGCKRMLLSNTYLRSLTKDNVQVHATAVTHILPNAVVGADGSVAEVDAIIFATGFHVTDLPIAQYLRDGNGQQLSALWASGAAAYYGTTISGFPNLFLMLGPTLGTGHSSAFTVAEAQLGYVMQAIATLHQRGLAQIDVRADVQERFNDRVQKAVQTTVYNAGGCASYYLDANGRNTFAWPWSMRALQRQMRRFDLHNYHTAVAATAADVPLARAATALSTPPASHSAAAASHQHP